MIFSKGDRVRHNEHYRTNVSPKMMLKPERIGTVLSPRPNGECYTVRWDGNKAGQSIHGNFIELAATQKG